MVTDNELLGLYSLLGYKEKDIDHVKRVQNLCKKFSENIPGLQNKLLSEAAILHDIAKKKNKKEHNKPKYVKEVLFDAKINDIDENVFEIIKAHKDEFDPPKGIEFEAAILRICDKLDKFTKAKNDAENKCDASIQTIKNYFGEVDQMKYEKFYQNYQNIVQELELLK